MKQLIRIEHPSDGKGIWHSKNSQGLERIDVHSKYEDIAIRHANPDVFPNLWDDEGFDGLRGTIHGTYLFGFLSIEQLKNGFTPEELDELICNLGFNVYLIEATDTVLTHYQGVFHPDSVVSKQDISTLFTLKK